MNGHGIVNFVRMAFRKPILEFGFNFEYYLTTKKKKMPIFWFTERYVF